VRQFFKWCVAEELVASSVYEALRTVPGLQPGRTQAPERKPIQPAETAQIEAALAYMPPPVAALVQLQLLSGARGGELLSLRAEDIDRSGPVWVYRPAQHKNAWRTRLREIFFGPRAIEILRPWLDRFADGPLFSPAAAEANRSTFRSDSRMTPRYASHMRYNATRRARLRGRPPGDQYTGASYRQAIERACARAFPLPAHLQRKPVQLTDGRTRRESAVEWRERIGREGLAEVRAWREMHTWTPHRLRHSAGTAIRREYGIELARIILGHSTAFTTELYAEVDHQQARDVIAKVG